MSRRIARSLRLVLARCAGVEGPMPWVDAGVARHAIELGLAAVVQSALASGRARASLADPRRAELRAAADREVALVLAAEVEAQSIAERLARANIPAIALKGLVTNARFHREHGWCRFPGDLDLLVRDSDAEAATRLFADDPAYESLARMDESFYDEHHHTCPFVRTGRYALPVELHRRISGVSTGGIRIDHVGCWERSIPFPELGPHLRRLDDVDHALATIIHIDRDDAYHARARQLFDLAFVWEACRERRDELFVRAEEWNAASTARRTLTLLDTFLERSSTSNPARALWNSIAIDLAIGTTTNDALPVWYRQGIFRAVTHTLGWRQVFEATLGPVARRI